MTEFTSSYSPKRTFLSEGVTSRVFLSTALKAGGGRPWTAFGGLALRVNGKVLRVLNKALVVETANG